jgi:uncharacterized protein (TIGR01244 family)
MSSGDPIRFQSRARPLSDPTDILNWRRLSERVTTSGQPREAQLAALAALGVKHVINLALHTHPKALADEAATVRELGMAYLHIPVAFDDPRPEDYEAFRAAMARIGAAPVHVHCIMNYRVSAFFYLYRQAAEGVDERAARAEMERIWRPGGVWAAFIGHAAGVGRPHQIAGADYAA